MLVFANKQDLPQAMSVSEVQESLGLHQLRGSRKVGRSVCECVGVWGWGWVRERERERERRDLSIYNT